MCFKRSEVFRFLASSKIMPLGFLFLSLLFGDVLFLNAQVETKNNSQIERDRIEAERLWEELIKAKGGREKLYSVSNMLRSKSDGQIELFVYPDRHWEWDRGHIVYNYLWLTMANMEKGIFAVVSQNGLNKIEKDLDERGRANYREGFLMDGCIFFLESRWLRPTPVKVAREAINKKQFDVVKTRFPDLLVYKDWGLDFFIEPESREVRFVRQFSVPNHEGMIWKFDNYTSINGIQMPQNVNAFLSPKEIRNTKCCNFTYDFNVQYNSSIFEKIPTEAEGRDAWRPRN